MVYFFCLLGYVVLCIVNYHKSKRIINIALIHSAMWFLLTALVLVMRMDFTGTACVFLFFNSLLFFFGYSILSGYFGSSVSSKNDIDVSKIEAEVRRFDKLHKYLVWLALFGLIYMAYDQGFRLRTFTNLNSLVSMMHNVASSRYTTETFDFSIVNRLINTVTTFGCAYEGYYFAVRRKKSYLILVLMYAAQGMIVSQKAALVYAFAFWLAGLITGLEFFHEKMERKTIIKLVSGILAILVFSTILNYFRHARQLTITNEIQNILKGYFIGPTAAFSFWLSKYDHSLDLGANTFSSIFRILGIASQEHGEMAYGNGFATNVYTVYKHLVSDYGIILTCCISFLAGEISCISDSYVRSGKKKLVGLNIIIITAILISFFTSLFRYTTTDISVLFVVMYTLVKIKYGDGGEKSSGSQGVRENE